MTTTDIIIITIVVVISIIDILLVIKRTPTISRRLNFIGKNLSIAPYAWGCLAGHFWPFVQRPVVGAWVLALIIVVFVGVTLNMTQEFLKLNKIKIPSYLTFIYVLAGLIMGSLFIPVV